MNLTEYLMQAVNQLVHGIALIITAIARIRALIAPAPAPAIGFI